MATGSVYTKWHCESLLINGDRAAESYNTTADQGTEVGPCFGGKTRAWEFVWKNCSKHNKHFKCSPAGGDALLLACGLLFKNHIVSRITCLNHCPGPPAFVWSFLRPGHVSGIRLNDSKRR